MKRKNFRLSLSLVVFLLVGVMCASTAVASFTGNGATIAAVGSTNSAISVGADHVDLKLTDVLDEDKIESVGKAYAASDKVSLIVTMDDTSLVDMWLANPQGYSKFSDYRMSLVGRNAAENLVRKQNALYNKIARSVSVTLKYNYVNVMNGFAIEIKYGDREKIDSIATQANIKHTALATHYDAPEDTTAVENEVTAYDTGIFDSEESIYERGIAGQGTVAAVLDTGLDWEHIAFSPEHPLFHKDEQIENKTLRFDEEYIQNALDSGGLLNTIRTRVTEDDEEPFTSRVTASDLYKNEKVAFSFDYADKDTEVSSDIDNSHGTHVAGIIAGHSDTPYEDQDGNIYLKGDKSETTYEDDYGDLAGKFYQRNEKGEFEVVENVVEVSSFDSVDMKNVKTGETPVRAIFDSKTKKQITGIVGVAPQAQLAIFKVFGDYEGGASTDALYAALEDCCTLGVDSINMSLGSDSGFQEDTGSMGDTYEVYDKVGKVGISLIVAASNSYSSGFNSHYGLNLTSNPDSATVGSPSTYDSAISVASISGVKTKYISATNGSDVNDDKNVYGVAYYQDAAHVNGESYDFLEDLKASVKAKDLEDDYTVTDKDGKTHLEIPYVTILGVGRSSDYSGKNVANKIALVQRGTTSFEDKVKAANEAGALACIIYNNVAGIIRMQVGDDVKTTEGLNFPACSITMDAAVPIRNKDVYASGGVTPKFVFDETKEAGPFMSEFSSWGPLPNLLMKPEITAHGGDIYSSIPGDETAYARMSGTSMACPNMAGVVTLMRSYMKMQDGKVNNPEKFDLWRYKYKLDENGNVVIDEYGNRVYDLQNGEKVAEEDEDGEKYIDENVLEQRIYQILMSTTTIAKDELGNPYSPRRQGAGLADLNRSETTEQYIFVKDKAGNETERTKLELLDDPKKTGSYKMEFYVRNVGTNKASYSISADVLTEGKSSDGKTVNEKAQNLNYSATLTIDDKEHDVSSAFDVPAGKTVKVVYTVNLANDAKSYLDTFLNGMYVEGYVKLTNTDKNGINLNVPYLAFYGDWADAPIFDYDVFETTADLNDDNIAVDYKRYSNTRELQVLAKLMQDNSEYALGLGQFAFLTPDGTTAPEVEEDKCALSYNEDGALFNIYCVGGFLRGVKKLFYRITDVATGELIKENVYFSARKAAAGGGLGGAWLDLDIKDLQLANNAQYQLTIYPVLDWHADQYPSAFEDNDPEQVRHEDIEKSINKIVEEGEKWNKDHANDGKSKRYSWSCKFWIDSDAPFISDTKVRVERDRNGDATYYLDMYLTDNHYISAMGLYVYDKDVGRFQNAMGDYLRVMDTDRNATTLVTYNITSLWEQINEGLLLRMNDPSQNQKDSKGMNYTQFQVVLYDYALNTSWYSIDLMELLNAEQHKSVKIGKTGNYREYTASGKSPVNILTSTNKEIEKDASGNYVTIDSLTLIPGQKVSLKNAIISEPSEAWRDELQFTASPSNIIRFDDETYELYALKQNDSDGKELQRASATLTITSRLNKNLKTELKIEVLTNKEVQEYGINASGLQERDEITRVTFKDGGGRNFNAGERYVLEAEINPWFVDFDVDKYFIGWEAASESIATVRPLGKDDPEYDDKNPVANALKAVVTANAARRDDKGNYIDDKGNPVPYEKNYASYTSINATVYQVIDQSQYDSNNKNHIYDEVNKRYGAKVGTMNSFTANVLQEFVVSGNTLSEYHGAGGNVVIPDNLSITTIGDMLFMNRDDIKSIVFPEGVETIGRASCAYMKGLEMIKLPSTLQTIGEFAFTASYSLDQEGPDTRLMIIDTSACTKKPFKASQYAFAMQRYVGVDLDKSVINDKEDSLEPNAEKKNEYKLLDEKYSKLFNTKMLRIAGQFSFYGMRFANNLDLTGLKAADVAAFYEYGAAYGKYTTLGECKITFGPNTMAGVASFISTGIKKLTIPMNHISEQMFFGSTVVRVDNNNTQTVDSIYGALEEIEFTADNLVIDDAAFVYTTVEKITFSGTVESIGEAAFYHSERLTDVTFKQKCKRIGAQAFAETAIESFTLPAGLEILGSGAFAYCDNLTTVNIDKECTLNPSNFGVSEAISENEGAPFVGCKKLSNFMVDEKKDGTVNNYLTVKNGVLYSEGGKKVACVPPAYVGNFKSIFDEVETIGAYSFGGVNFNGVSEVDLSKTSVKKIETGAFYYSTIKSIILNSNITEIGDAAFLGTPISKIDFGTDSKLTRIGDLAFYYPSENNEFGYLTSIKIPATVNYLGELAFAFQGNLRTVEFLGDKVDEIRAAAFFGTMNLTNLSTKHNDKTEKNTLYAKKLGEQSFLYCGLSELNLPVVEEIGLQAFAEMYKLKKITMPKVKTIGEEAFNISQSSLTEVVLSNNGEAPKLETIGALAFYGQSKLASIDLSTVKTIGADAFNACTGLNNINSLAKVENIGATAFANTAISKTNGKNAFELPTTLKNVGAGAFANSAIEAYAVADGSSLFFVQDGVLYKKTANDKNELVSYPSAKADETYTVNDNTARIGSFSFAGSKNLNTVNIPSSVTNIGDGAFYGSSVKEYKFEGLTAPELETTQDHLVTEYSDAYWWQLYRNFVGQFTYSTNGLEYKYNPLRQVNESDITGDDVRDENDQPLDIGVNTSFTGGGFNEDVSFEITLYYPSNAKGFDTFVWKNYFDNSIKTAEVREPAVDEVEAMIQALPDPNNVKLSDRDAIVNARSAYDRLPSDAQRAFVDKTLVDKLTACEKALEALGPVNPGPGEDEPATSDDVSKMINDLPAPEDVTLDDKAAIEAARKAYNSLSDADKAKISEDQLNKLEACEDKIAELEGEKSGCGCGGCGTITYGSGSGWGGLMAGLAVLALALVLILLPKRRNANK